MSTPAPSSGGGGSESEHDWLFDYIMSVFKAPTWEVPIMTFIDDNCVVFDTDDENKFAYSELHEKFKELVEGLLETHLTEIGVAPEDFVEICSTARNSRDVNKVVFDQILAVDDFLTFKKLMQKRNMELELEAVRALRGKPAATASSDGGAAGGAEAGDADGDDGDDAAGSDEDGDGDTEAPAWAGADEMDKALQASLAAYEVAKTDGQLEMAQLEQAIAASLALEQERLRLLKAVQAAEQAAQAAAEQIGKMAAEADELAAQSAALDRAASDTDDAGGDSKSGETPDTAATAGASSAEPKSSPAKSDSTMESKGGDAAASAVAVADSKTDEAPAPTRASPKAEPRKAEPKRSEPARPAGSGSGGGGGKEEEPPRGSATAGGSSAKLGGSSLLGDLPSLTKPSLPDIEGRVAAMQGALATAQADSAKARQQDAKRLAEMTTEEEMRRRADHLRKQRDLLRAKRQKQRDAALAKHESEQKSVDDAERERVAAASKRAAEASRAGLWGAKPKTPTPKAESAKIVVSDADQKRMALRLALAQRLKEDVLAAEDRRSATKKEEAFVSLDEKLLLVEQQREANARSKAEAEAALRRAAAKRARNVMSSVSDGL